MKILKPVQKRLFSVHNAEDMKIFRSFLVANTWGPSGCPFNVEDPYVSIPDMIKDKIARHYLQAGK